jgi:hypothetical protein
MLDVPALLNTAMLKNTERLGECKAKRAVWDGFDIHRRLLFIIVHVGGGGKERSDAVAFFKGDEVGGRGV